MTHRTSITTREMRLIVDNAEAVLAMSSLTPDERKEQEALQARFQEMLADLQPQQVSK